MVGSPSNYSRVWCGRVVSPPRDTAFSSSSLETLSPKTSASERSKDTARLAQVCKDFESVFLGYLLKSMRKTVPRGGLLDLGIEGDVFQEMMDAEICKAAANTNGIGIAKIIYKQLATALPRNVSERTGAQVTRFAGLGGDLG